MNNRHTETTMPHGRPGRGFPQNELLFPEGETDATGCKRGQPALLRRGGTCDRRSYISQGGRRDDEQPAVKFFTQSGNVPHLPTSSLGALGGISPGHPSPRALWAHTRIHVFVGGVGDKWCIVVRAYLGCV